MSPAAELPRRAILIVNSHSRRGEEAFTQARDKLLAAGVELIEALSIADAEQMEPAVASAVNRAPMVVVGGGDGSLSSTVDHFLGTETVFAVLPLGTANSFARTLGLPLNLDGAIEVIANGEPRRIDLGCIDGDYFANAAAMGLSPLIAESVPRGLKNRLGKLGYLLWAMNVATKFRPFRLAVDDSHSVHKLWATEVRIANGSHHGGVELVESAELDSGEIVVQVVSGRSLARLAWCWFATLFKLPHRRETVVEFHGREMKLSARPPQKISIDGEIAAVTPVTVSVARAAVWVAAPRENTTPLRSS